MKIDIIEGLDAVHLDHIEQVWAPLMKRQRNKAMLEFFTQLTVEEQTAEAFAAMLCRLGVPDFHWDWRRKCTIAPGTQRQAYGLVNCDQVEAAMMLADGHQTRLRTPSEPLVYVDFLATAPWNRNVIQRPARFHGLGTMLLGAAVEVSRLQGMDGRCGLHALPSAEGFYQRAGMQDLGADPTYMNLHYFEMDAAIAHAFLA
ncbi:GNAT family N-acetyltransferase [Oleiagrimonas citrea]|uniref:GNAT family N-acetyltransferase n=1 Tax=Oleiagrimonas citrea TaxID=1665687 RepID=A0A846ZGF7_9GAMM|nr:GNAT family N-acetyltransferase [Oleiagrimonas citrea]NKZ37372.1 GNAT family N-acetyltransferase [Oleiagrimonas citrea]